MNLLKNINIEGKRVLIRVDYNVPVSEGKVVNNFRITQAIPTIEYCLSQNCSIVLMSHLGRPKGIANPEYSLKPVQLEMETLLGREVLFSDDCTSQRSISTSNKLNPGEIHLLENLRFHKGETGNSDKFSAQLAQHGDVYINDAFGTAHRAHASNVGVVNHFTTCSSGLLLEKERKYLSGTIESPNHPFVVVLGGSKVSGKIELISHLMSFADTFIIGGAMAYTFLKVQGKNVGASLVDEENITIAENILNEAKLKNIKIILPLDSVVSKEICENDDWRISNFDDMTDMELGVDIGPESAALFHDIIAQSETILWNGPMGVFESPSFSTGTHSVASSISDRTRSGVITIVGGGDSATAVESFNLMSGFSHVSTGGGASLELLSGKYLPAFKALDEHV